MSIFNTQPPIINKQKLFTWLKNNYDYMNLEIIDSIKLNSERDYNLKIVTKNEKSYIIKISNSSENYEILSFQDSILKHLSKSYVKNFIPKTFHEEIKKFKDEKNRQCYIRILEYINGDIFANKQDNFTLCNNLAKFLGFLSKSLYNFDHPAAHRDFIWNSINIEWIEKYNNLFQEKDKNEIINIVLESYNKNVKNKLSDIRFSVIHGDANNFNIVVSKNEVIGLLDYGDSIYAPTVCELTVALAYSLMNTSDIVNKCCSMLKSYNLIYPLKKNEIQLISTLIAARLSITVIMAYKQKQKYPDNEYLIISENDAWNLLYKLRDIGLDKLTSSLLEITNYD
tara:strand:+ start:741 stop:1760 length:1020 start_codon:yes stop_codon:yes gene_type:complete